MACIAGDEYAGVLACRFIGDPIIEVIGNAVSDLVDGIPHHVFHVHRIRGHDLIGGINDLLQWRIAHCLTAIIGDFA